jgi:hypothetical protein
MTSVCIQRIATATPPHDVHAAFSEYASGMLYDPRARSVLNHMVQRAGINHRYSYVQAGSGNTSDSLDGENLFLSGNFSTTEKRMKLFEHFAPHLQRCVLDRLALSAKERSSIQHDAPGHSDRDSLRRR